MRSFFNRKRRPLERDLPPKVEELIEESKLYAHLQAVEKRLDATLTRKKLEWQESLINKPQRVIFFSYPLSHVTTVHLFTNLN